MDDTIGRYFTLYFNILAIAILSHSSYRNCAPSTSSQALFLSSTLSAMSLTTKKRFVMKQAESELFLPKGNEIIARVLRSPGRNLHEVDDEKGEKYLVSMPRKFRETIYIKRGSFVFVVPIKEGVKVKAEITQILDNENVLYIRDQKMWPKRFEIYAESITREAKRGTVASGTKKHDVIDEDMLPPSDTNDGDYDENDEDDKKKNGDNSTGDLEESEELGEDDKIEDSDGEESNSDDFTFKIYNPNRLKRL
ncbi:putative RNA-binding protein [Dirofilaria immitis]